MEYRDIEKLEINKLEQAYKFYKEFESCLNNSHDARFTLRIIEGDYKGVKEELLIKKRKVSLAHFLNV
ncbi:MAG: hypothetical protein NY202_01230 [Mollicutes bacterium UO1]